MDDAQLLTADEVAARLQVPLKTLYSWRAKRQGPPAYRVGRHLRYDPHDLDSWLASRADSRERATS